MSFSPLMSTSPVMERAVEFEARQEPCSCAWIGRVRMRRDRARSLSEGDTSLRRNLRKVFILLVLGLDFAFWVIGKVLILLGFDVGDVGKVFISDK
jgi:hypothetical protein